MALADSGAINTLMPEWLAAASGVELAHIEPKEVRIGTGLLARFATVQLNCSGLSWEAEVGFSDSTLLERWGVLGQASFFRYFVVTFSAAELTFDVTPDRA